MSDIRDVANLAGVSAGTVSNVFNNPDKVSQETIARVKDAAARLRYSPNRLARSLVSTKSYMLGIMVANIYVEAYSSGVKAISEYVKPRGYSMLLYNTDFQLDEEKAGVQQFLGYRVDGVIVMSPPAIKETEHLHQLIDRQIPVVLIAREGEGFDQIKMDYRFAVVETLEYLRGLGHKRVGVIVGPLHYSNGKPTGRWERLNIVIGCLREFGFPFSMEHVRETVGDNFDEGYRIINKWLDAGDPVPSCLMVLSDEISMGVIAGLEQRGLRIPDDVSIVGYSNMGYTRFPPISLTTVSREYDKAGTIAARLLINRLENPDLPPQGETVHNRLVIRNTCSAPKKPFIEADGASK